MSAFKLLDDTKLTFGKHKGSTPKEIATDDPNYIVWMYDTLTTKFCTKRLRDLCVDTSSDSWEVEREIDGELGYDGWGH